MREYIRKHGFQDTDEIIRIANALATKYGEAAAAATCDMYDAIAEAQGMHLQPAEPARTPTMEETGNVIRSALERAPATVPDETGKLVKKTSTRTMRKNAARDGAKMALVPCGDGCAFCKMLGSRGWENPRSSKSFDAHLHKNCRCEYVVRFGDDLNVEGYDPDALYDEFMQFEGSWDEKMNAMRREQYAANPEKYRLQDRIAYAKREDRLETYRKVKNTGAYSEYEELMTKKHVRGVAADMGLDPRDVKYKIERNPEMIGSGFLGHTSDDGEVITLYPDAFKNREELVKTIGHENIHLKQVRENGKVKSIEELAIREKEARDSEERWWESYVKATGYRQ